MSSFENLTVAEELKPNHFNLTKDQHNLHATMTTCKQTEIT